VEWVAKVDSEACRGVVLAVPIPLVEWVAVLAALVETEELAETMVVATELTEAIANTR
jgi:hypothetical protein